MAAIPTRYGGVQFRSRLESRWAAFFDLYKWKWEYEPLDLAGYIPDFFLHLPQYEESGGGPHLVEVKPALNTDDLLPHAYRMDAAGWNGYALILGVSPDVVVDANSCVGDAWRWQPSDILSERVYGDRLIKMAVRRWRKAGNLVQWRAPRG